MIDVAVIGAGAISSFHLDGYLAFPDRCRTVAVADTDVVRAQPDDPFRTRDGLLATAPRFHEKTASVGQFETNEITT